MNSKWITAVALTVSGLVVAGTASAQEKDQALGANDHASRDLAPANRAIELTIATGYEQGFGDVASGQSSLTDIGTAGGAVEVGAGYRLIPHLTLGVYGSGGMFARGDHVDTSSKIYTSAAGVHADWHFLPAAHELDPWVSLSTGWRGYWISADQGTTSLQGMEIAKLELGADYRVAQWVSVSPVVGADLSAFFTQSTPSSNGFQNVSNPNVNTFVFAGVMGRFDIPTSSSSSEVASR